MCKCSPEMEKTIEEDFMKKKRENEVFDRVCNENQSYIFGDGKVAASTKTFSVFSVEYKVNCKSGRVQNKKKEYNMLHKFCPFCGEKY